MRIDRFLAEMSIGTRSEVKKMIQKKRVSVNGEVITDTSFKVMENDDIIELDGERICFAEFEYYMLNKPAGVISASRADENCVVDLITDKKRNDLFPVGRLDKDTEGLLFITNDGMLAHKLLSPKKHVAKTYFAELDGILNDEAIGILESGVDIGDDKPTLPCSVERLSESSCRITITEGRYHQIKRMFETEGLKVAYLKRLSMGPLELDPSLEPGMYRKLTGDELDLLKNASE